MIKEIEELCAQLQVEPLGKIGILQQRYVHVLIAWPIESVSSHIAKRAQSRKGKGRRVEPVLRRALAKARIAHDIWPIVRPKAENGSASAAVINVRQESRCERPSRLEGND